MDNVKTCKQCGDIKPLKEYYKNQKMKDGHISVCKICFRKNMQRLRKTIAYRTKEKEYSKEYYQRPEVKERQKEYAKEYNQNPEVKERQKEYMKEYYARPKVKIKCKEYNQKPEVKERQKEYAKEYNQRPEVKEKHRKYVKEYRYIHKQVNNNENM